MATIFDYLSGPSNAKQAYVMVLVTCWFIFHYAQYGPKVLELIF